MLTKKYCQKCWDNTGCWGWINEKQWEEKGVVCCPMKYLTKGENTRKLITEQPPSKCPFFLEHII